MKKKGILRTLEALLFIAMLTAVLLGASRLVERKKSRVMFGSFLREPQAYDVLFFGDSRFMNGMLPMEMWADYGIAGYNLACYGNSVPASYWSMMNALDYAQPKLVVLAVNGIGDERKITGSSGDLHTAFDFFPLSRTKVRAMEDLMFDPEFPDAVDDEGNRYQDIKWEYYLTMGKYHGRWNELTKEDLSVKENYQKGGEVLVGITPYGDYEVVDEDRYAEEGGHGYAYLRRTIEECRGRGIDVLLIHMPDPAMLKSQMHAHTVGSIAQEYDVPYIDLMQYDSIIDYDVDFYDDQPHLNASGTQKMSDYIAAYISQNYDLPDRRQDEAYAHWHAQHEAYVDGKMERIRTQEMLNHVLLLLHDDDFDVRMAVRPSAALYNDELGVLLMHNIAREHVLPGNEYEMWSGDMYPLAVFDEAYWNYDAYFLQLKEGTVHEMAGEEARQAMQSVFGGMDADVMIEISNRHCEKDTVLMQF